MNRKILMVSLLVFGLGTGVSAMANMPGGAPATTPIIKPSITPQMAQCIAACEGNGGKPAVCWAECVTGK